MNKEAPKKRKNIKAKKPVAKKPVSKKPAAKKTTTPKPVGKSKKKYIEAVGRRKEAVARVRIFKDTAGIKINDKKLEECFPSLRYQKIILAPLVLIGSLDKLFVSIKVKGGGITGQAEAIRLGISRCLVKNKLEDRTILKKAGFLTRDDRIVERKKYGRKKARKLAQWSKR